MRAESKYTPPDDQKIKINADKPKDSPQKKDRKNKYSNCDQLIIL